MSFRTHLDYAGHFGHNYLRKYYMGTYLGLLWLPLVPALDVLMRSLLFGGFLGVSSGNRPYVIFLLIGSMGWYFFERTTYWGYRSLQYNRRYFRHLPVPRLPALTGSAIPGALLAATYGLIAVIISIYFRFSRGSFYIHIDAGSVDALIGLALILLYAWALGLFLGPLVLEIRDVRLLIRYPFAMWYMVTPILYSVQSIPPGYRAIAIYNPLTAPIEFVRHGLLQMEAPEWRSIVTSVAVLAIVLPIGLVFFARKESAAQAQL